MENTNIGELMFKDSVSTYCELSAKIKELEKQQAQLKDEICAYMEDNNLSKQVVDGYSLSYKVQHRTKVNDDKMLAIVKGWGTVSNDIVKTKEYVDEDKLESAVYNGYVSPAQLKELDACRTVTYVPVLRPTKLGGK